MANGKRYVELMVPSPDGGMLGLTCNYDTRDLLNSNCYLTYSKYLCLAQGVSDIGRFILSPRGDGYPRCSVQCWDGPYEASFLQDSGGYLYVGSENVSELWAEFNDSGDAVKIGTPPAPNGTWYKRGKAYSSVPADCGAYYYVVQGTKSDALEFRITDFTP